MDKSFEKEGDSLKVTTTKTTENTYNLNYLKMQLESIKDRKDRDNIQRDIEIAEVEEMIAESERLGIIDPEAVVIE